MLPVSAKRLGWTLGLLCLSGCLFPVRERTDLEVCDLAAHPLDVSVQGASADLSSNANWNDPVPLGESPALQPVKFEMQTSDKPKEPLPKIVNMSDRLKPPKDLPGSDAQPIVLPGPGGLEREQAIDRLFPNLPEMGADPQASVSPTGTPLTLADLQKLAMSNSPLIRQASANIQQAKGNWIQAKLWPNPNIGFEQDTAATSGGPGYLGGFVDQVIKTGGKLKLAAAAAAMDLMNAQYALRRAQTDLTAQVRGGYFAVLVAEKNLKISMALVQFTDEIYRIQVQQVKGTQAAPYEPMQLRVLAMQARANLVQARNRYTSAWKQLAASMGLPAMPATKLAGDADMPLPIFQYDQVLAQVLTNHTDVATAQAGIRKARFNLLLAKRTVIPDLDVKFLLQKDYSGIPFAASPSFQISAPIPVWNYNQGAIIANQAALMQAIEESHRVRDELSSRLADAFERYQNNRTIIDYYRKQILPDQLRSFDGTYKRHLQQPEIVGFADVVNAQQTLATVITTYVTILGSQWTAVVDLASLLQTDDLLLMNAQSGRQPSNPVPDLENLLSLPCCHTCSPVQDQSLRGGDKNWPEASPLITASQPKRSKDTPAPKSPESKESKPLSPDTLPPVPEPLSHRSDTEFNANMAPKLTALPPATDRLTPIPASALAQAAPHAGPIPSANPESIFSRSRQRSIDSTPLNKGEESPGVAMPYSDDPRNQRPETQVSTPRNQLNPADPDDPPPVSRARPFKIAD